jgi:hypothetical protein
VLGVFAHLRRFFGAIVSAVIRRRPLDGRDDELRRPTIRATPGPLPPNDVEAVGAGDGRSLVRVPEADRRLVTEASRDEHDSLLGMSSRGEAEASQQQTALGDPPPLTSEPTDVGSATSLERQDTAADIDRPIEPVASPVLGIEPDQLSASSTTATVPDVDGRLNEADVPLDSSYEPHLAPVVRTFRDAEGGEQSSLSTDVDTEPLSASESGSTVTNELIDEVMFASLQRRGDTIELAESVSAGADVVTELIATGAQGGALAALPIPEECHDTFVAPAGGGRDAADAKPSLADGSATTETIAECDADKIDLGASLTPRAGVATGLTAAEAGEDALATPTSLEGFDGTVVTRAVGVGGDLDAGPWFADESSTGEAVAERGADQIDLGESVALCAGVATELAAAETEEDALATPTSLEEFEETVVTPASGVGSGLDAEPWLADEGSTGEAVAEFGRDETEEPDLSGSPRATRRRQVPYERPPEPATEYSAAGLLSPPSDYRRWNRAIAEHLVLKTPNGSGIYLTITPRILARALLELDGASLDPDRAENLFAHAVSDLYRTQILTQRGRLRVLRRVGDDGLPDCIAFLALSVLAAYRMRGDEEATGLAYYVRLAELLRCDVSGAYPIGFDPIVFESLWHFLRGWVAQRAGRQLALADADRGVRRFIGLPLAHVPLRSLDIDKLPDFFVWAGYQPRADVTNARLASDFARWVRARGVLTPTGVAAFQDERQLAVVAQVRAELESWDGTYEESISRRSAVVEILFDPVQHRPEFFYVPRRPSGFPALFEDGVRTFEASDDGWYGRIFIRPQDGRELADGFRWQTSHSGMEFALRRAATSVVPLGMTTPLGSCQHRDYGEVLGALFSVRKTWFTVLPNI